MAVHDHTDSQLLRAYAEGASEAAFAELVRRHVDFVYSAARRMVCDPHLAEDVTQSVFVALAQNVNHLVDRPVLSGWLHRTSCNIAAQTVRSIERRRAREQKAVVMNELLANEPSESKWEVVAPHLDTALGELNETDRDALLLRYFEGKSAREMAEILATTEQAAQKRVNRAMERLRTYFSKRNVSVSTTVLVTLISSNAVQSAPIGLINTISLSLAAASIHAPATVAATQAIAMTTLKKIFVGTTLALTVGVGLYEAQKASDLQKQLQAARGQSESVAREMERLKAGLAKSQEQLAALHDENERLKRDNVELYKLRGEIPRLRNDSRELMQLKTNPAGDSTLSEALQWKERVRMLKQHVEQNPAAGIPELQLATERDWLDATRSEIKTEKDYRSAMSTLRGRVENKFANMLQGALRKYLDANTDQFPTDLAQLHPFFEAPVDDSLLQRYAILPREAVPSIGIGDPIITQRAPVDKELDGRIAIGRNGYGTTGSNGWKDPQDDVLNIKKTLRPVMDAYAADHGGQTPADPASLLPYLKTAEQKAAYERGLKLLKEQAE